MVESADGRLPFSALTGAIIGAGIEVHNALGCGFLESVYEEALAYEMDLRGIEYVRQVELPIMYKGKMVKYFVADLIVGNKVVVEVKAIRRTGELERAQVINYLKATGLPVGLILNFGGRSLEKHRVVFGADEAEA
jgi:GxxExxY protein